MLDCRRFIWFHMHRSDRMVLIVVYVVCADSCAPFACLVAGCGWQGDTDQKLRLHMKRHADALPFACSHPACEELFADKYTLAEHARSHHS